MKRLMRLCLIGLLFLTGCATEKILKKTVNEEAGQSFQTTVINPGMMGQAYTSTVITTVLRDPRTGFLSEQVTGNSAYSVPMEQEMVKVVTGAVVGGVIPSVIIGSAVRGAGSKCISRCAPSAEAQAGAQAGATVDLSIK